MPRDDDFEEPARDSREDQKAYETASRLWNDVQASLADDARCCANCYAQMFRALQKGYTRQIGPSDALHKAI